MYKVSFDRTLGIVSRMIDTLHKNKPLAFIDEYPDIINDIKLSDVNNAIKKYYSRKKCITITSGTLK